jgi:hypothetical protein
VSGRRKKTSNVRQLSESDLLNSFGQSLDTLAHIAGIYDGGFAPISLVMATEVRKILTENAAATRLRGAMTFTTPRGADDPRNLSSMNKLTMARLGGSPPALTFLPQFYQPQPEQLVTLPFRDWWNKDVIYRAGAAPPGTPPGMIPVNGSPTVPFEKREKTTRMGLVNLLRNNLGAHQTSEMPALIDTLEEARSWGNFALGTPDGMLSTDDGSLKALVSPMAAMMRQISHELLVAYGRTDPPPPETV